MASTTNADGTAGGELAGRLSRMSDRTSLMVIDATLRVAAAPALAGDGAGVGAGVGAEIGAGMNTAPIGFGAEAEGGFADAALEMRSLARRMLQATQDFQAVILEPAPSEPAPCETAPCETAE